MKGFRNFAKGIGGAVLKSGDGSVDSTVEDLLQRTADGVLAEDRREALADLRDLLSDNVQAQLAVGSQGLPVLCTTIKEERGDVDMLRAALECLSIAIGNPTHQSEAAGKGPQPAALNAELFSIGKDNINLLLGLLDDAPAGVPDFHVRYHTVQLLTALAAVSSYRVQEAILAAPMGVVHLMDMMTDMEALRNEVLLLLVGLTRSNQSIQQIAAFEGAFERLLNIIRDEGAADGGIVVEDCLDMMNNLLRGNAKNQHLFTEMGYLSSLPCLLRTQASMQKPLARQKIANLLAALDSLYLLLAPIPQPSSPQKSEGKQQQQQDKAGTQNTLLKAGCMDALLPLVGASSVVLRSQALKCIWQLTEGNHACQQHLLEALAPSFQGIATPALQVVLRIALHGNDTKERIGALKVMLAFCIANREGQQALVSTMPLPGTNASQQPGKGSSFGSELVQCLLDTSPAALLASGRAARVLSYLLADNEQCKQMLTSQQSPSDAHVASDSQVDVLSHVLGRITALSSDGVDGSNGVSAPQHPFTLHLHLLLAITWVAGVPFAGASHPNWQPITSILVDCVKSGQEGADPITAGLAATLLGACLSSLQQGQQDEIMDAIKHQVGVSSFFAAIQNVQQTPEFAAGLSGLQVPRRPMPTQTSDPSADGADDDDNPPVLQTPPQSGHENPFDPQATQLILTVECEARQRLLGKQAGPSASRMDASHASMHDSSIKLHEAELLIQHLQRELTQLRTSTAASASSTETSVSPHASNQQQATELVAAQKACNMAEAKANSLRDSIQQLTRDKTELQTALTAAKLAEQDSLSSAQRLETELSDLASAYNNLEVQSYQLEAQIKRLQQQADQAAPSTGNGTTAEPPATVDDPTEIAAEESAMDDLLTCLGIEELKAQMFQAKLEEMGIDVQPMLDSIENG